MSECDRCKKKSEVRICDECGARAEIIDCGHSQQPTFISASEKCGMPICDYCAEKIELDKKQQN